MPVMASWMVQPTSELNAANDGARARLRALAGIMGIYDDLNEIDKIIAEAGMESTVEDKIKAIIADQLNLDIKEESIASDATFESLNMDSLDVIEIVMAMKETFDIEIPDEEIEKIKTVQDAIDYIKKLKL